MLNETNILHSLYERNFIYTLRKRKTSHDWKFSIQFRTFIFTISSLSEVYFKSTFSMTVFDCFYYVFLVEITIARKQIQRVLVYLKWPNNSYMCHIFVSRSIMRTKFRCLCFLNDHIWILLDIRPLPSTLTYRFANSGKPSFLLIFVSLVYVEVSYFSSMYRYCKRLKIVLKIHFFVSFWNSTKVSYLRM